jgi:hypothetical protein
MIRRFNWIKWGGICATVTLLLLNSYKLQAQNINGEKIQVAAEALTVLKFNSEIKRYEFGERKGYTCLVRDNDNSIVIKTVEDNPGPTNLIVTEGKRSHYFIISFLPKIDINNTKLYYDYSDLKALKKLVQNKESEPVAFNPPPKTEDKEEVSKKEKKRLEREKQEQEEALRKQEEIAEQQRKADKEREIARLKKLQEEEDQKKTAKQQEEARIAAEKQKQEQEALLKRKAAKKEQLAKEEEKLRKEKEKQEQLALAKEEARKKKEAEEQERIKKIQDEKLAAAAKQKEEARLAAEQKKLAAEEKERKRIEAEREKQLAIVQEKQRKEDERLQKLALQEEAKRKKAEEERARLAAIENKTEYTQAELWKKYPNIVFGDPPEGQHMAGEYYVPADTLENFRVSRELITMPPWMDLHSDTVSDVSVTLQSMVFSGVNCYMRFLVRNQSKKDFLVGRMNLNWAKGDQASHDLFPCYVTGYPVVLPGKYFTMVYVSRAVNAEESDTFTFSLKDRFKKIALEVPITGAMYNLEMSR